jgi:hypothetical protein
VVYFGGFRYTKNIVSQNRRKKNNLVQDSLLILELDIRFPVVLQTILEGDATVYLSTGVPQDSVARLTFL